MSEALLLAHNSPLSVTRGEKPSYIYNIYIYIYIYIKVVQKKFLKSMYNPSNLMHNDESRHHVKFEFDWSRHPGMKRENNLNIMKNRFLSFKKFSYSPITYVFFEGLQASCCHGNFPLNDKLDGKLHLRWKYIFVPQFEKKFIFKWKNDVKSVFMFLKVACRIRILGKSPESY